MTGRLPSFPIAYSLRARILTLVLAGVASPLVIVAAWLLQSSSRAAETLVDAQLEAMLARAEVSVTQQWNDRRSDVRLLAENEPIARAIAEQAGASDTLPTYVRDAFASARGLSRAVFRDRAGLVRWTLSTGAPDAMTDDRSALALQRTSALLLTVPIRSLVDSARIGDVEAWVPTSAFFVGADPNGGWPVDASLAVYERASGRWISPRASPLVALDSSTFQWESATWIARRRSLVAPPIDLVASAPLDPVSAPFQRAARFGAAALALVVAGVVGLATVGSKRLTHSLTRLASVADAVSKGDLNPVATVESKDEVGRVAYAFNRMLASMRRMMTERAQQEAMAAVGELAATIAHQVRTPLTAMKLDLQRADEALPVDGPLAQSLVRGALGEVQRLDAAVTASLRIARSGSGAFAALDLHDTIRNACRMIEPRALERGVRIVMNERLATPRIVIGDSAALVQMLVNVIGNAADAAISTVQLDTQAQDDGSTDVCVHDDGPGIASDLMGKVGEPFFSTKPGGTGLGLAIARRVATAHGGRLAIESGPGEGTTVRMLLRA